MLKSSLTSCFKHFFMTKFSKHHKKDKCSLGSWPACRLLYLYIKQSNSSKGKLNHSTNFLLFNNFLLESFVNKVAGLQDCCKACFTSTLKILFFFRQKCHQISTNYILLKNVKCRVMLTEAYLEPSWTSTMVLFCENS